MSSNAFSPQPTNSACLSVTSTSTATPIQVKGALNNATQRMFYNGGTKDCFVAWSKASNPVAVVPTAGNPATGIPIAAGAIIVFSIPPDAYFAAICNAAETTTLYITAGEGN